VKDGPGANQEREIRIQTQESLYSRAIRDPVRILAKGAHMMQASTGFVATTLLPVLTVVLAACGSSGTGAGDQDTGVSDSMSDPGTGDQGLDSPGDFGSDPGGDDSTATPDAAEDTIGPEVAADLPPDGEDDVATDVPTDPGSDGTTDAPQDLPADLPEDLPPDAVESPRVAINEVVATAPNMGPDWVELYNHGAVAVDLSGWMLKDDSDIHIFTIPLGTSIAAGEFLTIEGPGGVPPLATLFGFGKADSARLFLPSGTLVDQASWIDGQAPLANSWGRYPDGIGPFGTLLQPTRGAPNVAP
jgi:hypothetical protein